MKTTRPSFAATLASILIAASPALHAASCCSAPAPENASHSSAPAASTTPPLPARSLFQLDAKWTTDSARELTLRELRGETLVVTMIFTHCEYACPMLVQDLRKIRDQLPPATRARVRFVLITFDTERDTPEVLKTYRDAQTLDGRWTLLRGQPSDTQTLAMLLGVQFRREATGQFGHSNVITILNPDGEIVHQRTGLRGGLEGAAEAIVRTVPAR
jgi:protein SCO1